MKNAFTFLLILILNFSISKSSSKKERQETTRNFPKSTKFPTGRPKNNRGKNEENILLEKKQIKEKRSSFKISKSAEATNNVIFSKKSKEENTIKQIDLFTQKVNNIQFNSYYNYINFDIIFSTDIPVDKQRFDLLLEVYLEIRKIYYFINLILLKI